MSVWAWILCLADAGSSLPVVILLLGFRRGGLAWEGKGLGKLGRVCALRVPSVELLSHRGSCEQPCLRTEVLGPTEVEGLLVWEFPGVGDEEVKLMFPGVQPPHSLGAPGLLVGLLWCRWGLLGQGGGIVWEGSLGCTWRPACLRCLTVLGGLRGGE